MIQTFLKAIAALLVFTACSSPSIRTENVEAMALAGGFTKAIINTSQFQLLSYYRLTDDESSVTIYIEGDGYAFAGRHRISLNPTPKNPVSLKLALLDESANVIYIARPCQYVPLKNNPECQSDCWTIKRYAPEVIEAINEVIDDYKKIHNFKNIRLVGYSGGGTVAAILAAQRDDVLDLRTAAGNLDIEMFVRQHNVTPLAGSLNPQTLLINSYPFLKFILSERRMTPLP